VSNGQAMKRPLSTANTITLPVGANGDQPLLEGEYIICVCDNDEGSVVSNGTLSAGGCNATSEFVLLSSKISIMAVPRLGLASSVMDIRAVTLSSPTYRLWATGTSSFDQEDVIFASAHDKACSSIAIPQHNRHNETALMALRDLDSSTLTAMFQLPQDVQLEAASEVSSRALTVCYTTKESGGSAADFVRLSSTIIMIPEPTAALETSSWFVNNIDKLTFNEPQGNAGIQGDIIVLEQFDCSTSYLRNTVESFPISSGVRALLQSDGVAREYAIAQGKFNELPAGTYKICYATKTSEGDAQDDFRLLTKTVRLEAEDAIVPTVEVEDTVSYGSDLVVRWAAGNGLQNAVAAAGSWMGLYRSKSCSSADVNIHKCYIAYRMLPENVTSGELRFNQLEYKEAGDYDVRYFTGDTRHGQGVVCRGLKEIKDTYLQCVLEASTTSRTVFVDSEEPTSLAGDIGGLEAVFDGGEELFEIEASAFTA